MSRSQIYLSHDFFWHTYGDREMNAICFLTVGCNISNKANNQQKNSSCFATQMHSGKPKPSNLLFCLVPYLSFSYLLHCILCIVCMCTQKRQYVLYEHRKIWTFRKENTLKSGTALTCLQLKSGLLIFSIPHLKCVGPLTPY